jgi:glycosyltransferase involved in cell wall biosynthesis
MVCGSYGGGNTGLSGPFKRGVRRAVVDGIEVIEFNLRYSNRDRFVRRAALFLLFALRSIALAFSEKYDLLYASTTPLTAGIPGIFARWLRGKSFVFEVRDLWPELPRAMGVIRNPVILGAMSALEWLSYCSAHRLVGLSPGIVDGIVRRGVPRERVTLSPNGSDLAIFGSAVTPWSPDGVASTDLVAVFAGTHGIANGLDAVLDAARELKRRRANNIKLLLIGQGMLKADLQRRASAEELDSVIFLDPVDKDRLASLMRRTDIGMQILANVPAFYYGTSPNKFFDYIAAGLPVLINYPGWLAEVVREHDCGFAVPPEDPGAFADVLEQAAANRARLQDMGRRARDLAVAQFNRDVLANRLVDWLEREFRALRAI